MKVGIVEGVSGGVGGVGRGKEIVHGGERSNVEGGDVGMLAEAASLVESHGKSISPEFVSKHPKTMSPTKIGDIWIPAHLDLQCPWHTFGYQPIDSTKSIHRHSCDEKNYDT